MLLILYCTRANNKQPPLTVMPTFCSKDPASAQHSMHAVSYVRHAGNQQRCFSLQLIGQSPTTPQLMYSNCRVAQLMQQYSRHAWPLHDGLAAHKHFESQSRAKKLLQAQKHQLLLKDTGPSLPCPVESQFRNLTTHVTLNRPQNPRNTT